MKLSYMKWIVVILFLCAPQLWAQQTESRNVGGFKGVKVSEGIDVYLQKGDQESVRVEASGIPINDVLTEVSGDYLRIHLSQGRWRGSRTVKVYVTYVELSKLAASSAGNIYSDGTIKGRSISMNASSAGSIEVKVDVESLAVSASSAAEIELKGRCKSIEIDVSSAGEVDAYDLESEEATISASSAGSVKIHVTKRIEARASSGADIRYRGSPNNSNTNSSSGGSVKKAN